MDTLFGGSTGWIALAMFVIAFAVVIAVIVFTGVRHSRRERNGKSDKDR